MNKFDRSAAGAGNGTGKGDLCALDADRGIQGEVRSHRQRAGRGDSRKSDREVLTANGGIRTGAERNEEQSRFSADMEDDVVERQHCSHGRNNA